MFSIGQHVIHPGQGVCTVVGFRDDTPQPMLLLETKQGHAQTILMYPVAQADRLHAAISQQDAEHLLSHYDELECDTFTERNSSLEETHFKQQLKLGAPETVRVAKTMMHRIRQAEEADKKPSSYYMRVLKEAKRRSIEEFAVALGVTEDVTKMPVLRPLIGTDKVEIIRMAREIGTYETSILPYEDCCTVFTPRHPATRPVLEDVVKAESVLDIDGLVTKALEGETWVRVKPQQ